MAKRMTALVLVLLLALSAAGTALATELTGQCTLENVFSASLNMRNNVIAVRFYDESGYRLIAADGTPITEPIYLDISDLGAFFEVQSEEGLNARGVIDAAGNQVLPNCYADILLLNDRWILGVVLEDATAESYDYKSFSGSYYNVSSYHVYYCGTKVGELSRMDYSIGAAYGDYLYVKSREGAVSFYNKAMEPSGYETSTYNGEYDDLGSKGVFHRGSGQMAFVPECTLTSEEVDCDRYLKNGMLLDLQGNVVAYVNAQRARFNEDPRYGLTYNDGKYGLVDRDGNVLLPCEYEYIAAYREQYFAGGYQVLVKDGKVSYADAQGNITADFVYSESVLERTSSPFSTIRDLDGSVIVLSGAVGALGEHFAEVANNTASAPLILVANDANQTSVLDLEGHALLENLDRDPMYFDVSCDGTVLLMSEGSRTYTVYTFDQSAPVAEEPVIEQPETVEPAGAENAQPAMAFCPNCGTKLPEEVPNFCSSCGQKLK